MFIFHRLIIRAMRKYTSLTKKDKDFIRKVAKMGPYSKAELARLYQVSRSRISQITKEDEGDEPQDDS